MMEALQILGCSMAAVCGWAVSSVAIRYQAQRRRVQKMRKTMGIQMGSESQNDPYPEAVRKDSLLLFWVKTSQQIETHALRMDGPAKKLFGRSSLRWMQKHERLLGIPQASFAGLCESRFRLGCLGAVLACLLGYAVSGEGTVCAIAAVLGFVAGSRVLFMSARAVIAQRKRLLESELPQVLALVSLGLKSGLSFDQSFALYPAHFDTDFSKACAQAQKTWTMALASREDALRALAASYDSSQLKQVVEAMIRSLRFGTALAENLDITAAEARNQYRANCQEAIAKAPVRMMIPTCVLILPALLILVLGPILLEMVNGF